MNAIHNPNSSQTQSNPPTPGNAKTHYLGDKDQPSDDLINDDGPPPVEREVINSKNKKKMKGRK